MTSAANGEGSEPAIRRLLHDFKEVISHPLQDVVAQPTEDDLFIWHGNVRGGTDTKFTDVPFHFVLVFPSTYPCDAPQVGLYTRLPHPNIVRWRGPKAWTECRLALWDCNPEENQWTSAYTVHSILIQIQAFLIAEDMIWSSQTVNLHQAVRHAAQLNLKDKCPHSGTRPWPAFATEEEIQAAAEKTKRLKLVVHKPQNKRVRAGPIWSPVPSPPKSHGESRPQSAPASAPAVSPPLSKMIKEQPPPDLWQVVEHKRKASAAASVPVSTTAGNSQASASGHNIFSLLTKKNETLLSKQEGKANDQNKMPAKVVQQQQEVKPIFQESKASKKNKARAKKRAEQKAGIMPAGSSSAEAETPSTLSTTSTSTTSEAPKSQDTWMQIPQKKQKMGVSSETEPVKTLLDTPHKQLIRSIVEEVQQAEENIPDTKSCERDPAMGLEMGLFSSVPLDLLTTILTSISRKDMAVLATTCKGMHACCNDGEIWKLLLERDFSSSKVTAARSTDWKHAYSLQAANIIGELQCFHSKASFEETVIGMPLYCTVNPRTGAVDYIRMAVDLLSVESFRVLEPESTADLAGEDILEVCPLYLNENHFQAALPHFKKVLKTLNPAVPPHQLHPAYWLDTCAKMLNTAVLLLIDKGMTASEKAIHCYCQAHRVMLALAEHFNLWEIAIQRLDNFIRLPAQRNKTTCPNLGWLIALLAVSPKHGWSDVVIPALLESLDRSVIWACKEHQELVDCYKKPEAAGGVDQTLLDRVFETTRVGRGIITFHAAFMRTIARPGKLPLEKVMDQADSLYGYASEGQIKHIQSIIKRSQEIKTWQEYCKLIGAQPYVGKLTFEAFMTKQLRRSWQNSLAKGYHKKDTDFSRIQASGVSKILLKGQTFSAPPNIKFMHVKDTWRCKVGTSFLDMSLLIYHFDGHRIDTVDYSHDRSIGTHRIGAVTHSGDIHLPNDEFGTGGCKMAQTGDIDFDGLGKHVKEVYLLASAWMGADLADFRQPQIILSDPKTGTSLCEYTLEEHSLQVLKQYKALMMCRIYRETETSSWKVEAIGEKLKHGSADSYGPIHEYIRNRQRGKK